MSILTKRDCIMPKIHQQKLKYSQNIDQIGQLSKCCIY